MTTGRGSMVAVLVILIAGCCVLMCLGLEDEARVQLHLIEGWPTTITTDSTVYLHPGVVLDSKERDNCSVGDFEFRLFVDGQEVAGNRYTTDGADEHDSGIKILWGFEFPPGTFDPGPHTFRGEWEHFGGCSSWIDDANPDYLEETLIVDFRHGNQPPYDPNSIQVESLLESPGPVSVIWEGGDPDGDPVTYIVRLLDSADELQAENSITWNETYAEIDLTLTAGVDYTIEIQSEDPYGEKSALARHSFTSSLVTTSEGNQPPHDPHSVFVEDLLSSPGTVSVLWQGGDPDGDSVTYDVWLRDVEGTLVFYSATTWPDAYAEIDITLESDTEYVLEILAEDPYGALSALVQYPFTSSLAAGAENNRPPHDPHDIVVEDLLQSPGIVGVIWEGGDPDGDPVSYLVSLRNSAGELLSQDSVTWDESYAEIDLMLTAGVDYTITIQAEDPYENKSQPFELSFSAVLREKAAEILSVRTEHYSTHRQHETLLLVELQNTGLEASSFWVQGDLFIDEEEPYFLFGIETSHIPRNESLVVEVPFNLPTEIGTGPLNALIEVVDAEDHSKFICAAEFMEVGQVIDQLPTVEILSPDDISVDPAEDISLEWTVEDPDGDAVACVIELQQAYDASCCDESLAAFDATCCQENRDRSLYIHSGIDASQLSLAAGSLTEGKEFTWRVLLNYVDGDEDFGITTHYLTGLPDRWKPPLASSSSSTFFTSLYDKYDITNPSSIPLVSCNSLACHAEAYAIAWNLLLSPHALSKSVNLSDFLRDQFRRTAGTVIVDGLVKRLLVEAVLAPVLRGVGLVSKVLKDPVLMTSGYLGAMTLSEISLDYSDLDSIMDDVIEQIESLVDSPLDVVVTSYRLPPLVAEENVKSRILAAIETYWLNNIGPWNYPPGSHLDSALADSAEFLRRSGWDWLKSNCEEIRILDEAYNSVPQVQEGSNWSIANPYVSGAYVTPLTQSWYTANAMEFSRRIDSAAALALDLVSQDASIRLTEPLPDQIMCGSTLEVALAVKNLGSWERTFAVRVNLDPTNAANDKAISSIITTPAVQPNTEVPLLAQLKIPLMDEFVTYQPSVEVWDAIEPSVDGTSGLRGSIPYDSPTINHHINAVPVGNAEVDCPAGAQVTLLHNGQYMLPSRRHDGRCMFDDLPVGEYRIQVLGGSSTPPGPYCSDASELWTYDWARIIANSTSTVVTERKMPSAVGIRYADQSGATIPSGGEVLLGTSIRATVEVQNSSAESWPVRVTWVGDSGFQPSPLEPDWPETISSSSELAANGGTHSFSFECSPSALGTYQRALKVETLIDGNWQKTDAWGWGDAFTLVESSTANLTVICKTLSGGAAGGAKVLLLDSEWTPVPVTGNPAIADSTGIVVWEGLEPGEYTVQLWGGSDVEPFGATNGELWALATQSLGSGENSWTLQRNLPYISSNFTILDDTRSPIGGNTYTPPGYDVHAYVSVTNPSSESHYVHVTFVADVSEGGSFDWEENREHGVNAGTTFAFNRDNREAFEERLYKTGWYSVAAKIELYIVSPLGARQRVITDTYAWVSDRFRVKDY